MDALIFISGHEGNIRVFFENLVNAISGQIKETHKGQANYAVY